MARIAPAPAHTPSTAAMIGCGQARIAADQVAGHAREVEQAALVHLGQRPDDLMDVAARAEIAAGAGDHDAP